MDVRIARGVTVAAVAVLTAACTKTLNTGDLESELATQLQTRLSAPTLSVSCPEGVKVQAQASFQCTAVDPNGDSLSITVTQTDDEGNVSWELTGVSTAPPSTTTTSPTASASASAS